ncbi:MAG: chemoreceptor glutamine deamidase CheD [Ignavibacteria bacterium]
MLPGFEHIRRSWSVRLSVHTARILPGEYYVTRQQEGISTTLGSCIAACIRDRVAGLGGMNHFMLPAGAGADAEDWKAAGLGAATRYGNYAMEHLVNEIMRNGGRRENLEVKIFGGGQIMEQLSTVGARNIAFVRDYLAAEGLPVVAEDVGDIYPRMVIYFPVTGVAKVKRLRSLHNNMVVSQEDSYGRSISAQPVGGDVELF